MSLGLIITGVVCLLLLVIIVASTSKSKKKKQVRFLDPLNRLAESADCKISNYDIWNDSVIGIDGVKNVVFAIRKTNGTEENITINLAEIFRCRVAEISRVTGPKEGNMKVFDRIDLVFVNKEKSKSDQVIVVYSSNTDRLTLAGELQLAEKWCTLVNNKLATIGK